MLYRHLIRRAAVPTFLAVIAVGTARGAEPPAATAPSTRPAALSAPVELRDGQGLILSEQGVGPAAPATPEKDDADVRFVWLAPRPAIVRSEPNPLHRGQMEQRISPAILKDTPALRADRVAAYGERPDVARLTLGDVKAFGPVADLTANDRFALVRTRAGETWLLSIDASGVAGPRPAAWAVTVRSAERVTVARGEAGQAPAAAVAGRIVFGETADGATSLVAVDTATGRRSTLVTNVGRRPRASRDGKRFAWQAADDERRFVVADAAGKPVGGVTLAAAEEARGGWDLSADGTLVAVGLVRETPDGNRRAAVVYATATGRPVREFAHQGEPAFAADGRLLVVATGEKATLSIADPADGRVTAVADLDRASQLAASPDGKTIAYVDGDDRLWLVNADGTNKRRAWQTDRGQERPAFSPDGARLAATSFDRTVYSLPRPVTVIDLVSGRPTDLQDDKGNGVFPPSDAPTTWVP